MNLTTIQNCANCRANFPRFCLAHTCLDCGSPVTNVGGHTCPDDPGAFIARIVNRLDMLRNC